MASNALVTQQGKTLFALHADNDSGQKLANCINASQSSFMASKLTRLHERVQERSRRRRSTSRHSFTRSPRRSTSRRRRREVGTWTPGKIAGRFDRVKIYAVHRRAEIAPWEWSSRRIIKAAGLEAIHRGFCFHSLECALLNWVPSL